MFTLGSEYELRDELGKIFWKDIIGSFLELKIIQINNVTNMKSMFNQCSSLISFSEKCKWNTDNVIDMSFMFSGCICLEK